MHQLTRCHVEWENKKQNIDSVTTCKNNSSGGQKLIPRAPQLTKWCIEWMINEQNNKFYKYKNKILHPQIKEH